MVGHGELAASPCAARTVVGAVCRVAHGEVLDDRGPPDEVQLGATCSGSTERPARSSTNGRSPAARSSSRAAMTVGTTESRSGRASMPRAGRAGRPAGSSRSPPAAVVASRSPSQARSVAARHTPRRPGRGRPGSPGGRRHRPSTASRCAGFRPRRARRAGRPAAARGGAASGPACGSASVRGSPARAGLLASARLAVAATRSLEGDVEDLGAEHLEGVADLADRGQGRPSRRPFGPGEGTADEDLGSWCGPASSCRSASRLGDVAGADRLLGVRMRARTTGRPGSRRQAPSAAARSCAAELAAPARLSSARSRPPQPDP